LYAVKGTKWTVRSRAGSKLSLIIELLVKCIQERFGMSDVRVSGKALAAGFPLLDEPVASAIPLSDLSNRPILLVATSPPTVKLAVSTCHAANARRMIKAGSRKRFRKPGMSTISDSPKSTVQKVELHSGDRYSREEFHRLYLQTPEDFKAELIGGIVYVSPRGNVAHGTNRSRLSALFYTYEVQTPGIQTAVNAAVLLAEDSEPQPDLLLRILPEHGGNSSTTATDYISGPPELIAEIAHSSHALDLHAKREDYQQYGVKEYLVLSVRDHQLLWFDLERDEERERDEDGIMKLTSFPGLWIHSAALLSDDYQKMMAVLREGLASDEHAEFVKKLAEARAS
jgi:hypothetical protein